MKRLICVLMALAFATASVAQTASSGGIPTPVSVPNGGNGVATLAAHGVVVGNGTSPVNVTGAGTSGQVFTSNGASADPSFQPAGGTPAETLISTASPSGASVFSFTSIPQTCKDLRLVFRGETTGAGSNQINLTFNSDTAGHYGYEAIRETGGGACTAGTSCPRGSGDGQIKLALISNTNTEGAFYPSIIDLMIYDYTSATQIKYAVGTISKKAVFTTQEGWWDPTGTTTQQAITRIDGTTDAGNYTSATSVSLYCRVG